MHGKSFGLFLKKQKFTFYRPQTKRHDRNNNSRRESSLVTERTNERLTIVSNEKIVPGYYLVVFEGKKLARFSFPGQFCMLSLPGVFLRRPLSVFSIKGSKIGFLYKVVGKATSELSKLKKGDKLDVLGPLGEPYTANINLSNKIPILVAGGTGIVSLHFLAQKIILPGILFYGAKKKEEFIPLKLNSPKKWKIQFSTEDGSKGYKGLITNYLEKFLIQNKGKEYVVFSCGPNPMLKKVAQICKNYNIEGYVSLEEMMACGVGNCQGCAVRSGNTYKMVCKDGPVFSVNDIEL